MSSVSKRISAGRFPCICRPDLVNGQMDFTFGEYEQPCVYSDFAHDGRGDV